MKAIETRYKGYRFRSRLEARWAVFFDAIGIEWVYEPEGFELGGGMRYLPDFKIEGKGPTYVEVKATEPTQSEKRKAQLLARGVKGTVIFAVGVPDVAKLPNMLAYSWIEGVERGEQTPQSAALTAHCFRRWGRVGYWMEDTPCVSNADVVAVNRARAARFEFGEVPS